MRRLIVLVLAGVASLFPGAGITSAQDPAPPPVAKGVIDGVITDTLLAPLAEASVTFLGSTARVVTGENGRFRVTDVAPGTYIVLVRHIGFEATSARVEVVGSTANSLELKVTPKK